MERTDGQLIADHFGGDESAVRFLVERHLKPVYNFVVRLTGDRDEAEDITQEALVKMWRHLGRYRAAQNFRTWLYTIARRTAIDHWRKKRHRPFSDFEDEQGNNFLAENLADQAPLPDEAAMTAEEIRVAATAAGSLPDRYQAVFFLRHNEDLTFEEIGEVLGKPLNTVKSQYRRAVALLRRRLAEGTGSVGGKGEGDSFGGKAHQ